MAGAVILGTITAPIATGGPTAAMYIGSPKTTQDSTSATVEFNEAKSATLKIDSTSGVVTVSLDSVSSGNILYVGCDYQTDVTINGNAHMIGDGTGTTADGGFIMLQGGDVTTLTVEAQLVLSTTITVAIYGD